jgi:hypothetical protein
MKKLSIIFSILLLCITAAAQSPEKIQQEVWQRELQYWKYVGSNDTTGYLTLWHENFIGYPGTGSLTRKDKIATWITEVHSKKDMHYEYRLIKKAVNVFGDVAVTFYDEEDIWKNNKNEIVSKETFKITHTWQRHSNSWLIIGGMSALVPNDL